MLLHESICYPLSCNVCIPGWGESPLEIIDINGAGESTTTYELRANLLTMAAGDADQASWDSLSNLWEDNWDMTAEFEVNYGGQESGNTGWDLTDKVWHHVAVTYDSSTQTRSFYLNGTEVGTETGILSGTGERWGSVAGLNVSGTQFRLGMTPGVSTTTSSNNNGEVFFQGKHVPTHVHRYISSYHVGSFVDGLVGMSVCLCGVLYR